MPDVREMKPSDFQQIRQVLAPYFDVDELNIRMRKIEDVYSNKLDNPVTYRVATIDGSTEGLIGFRNPPEYLLPFTTLEKPIELYMLFVKERIKGIGRKLVLDMEDLARTEDFNEIVVFSALRRKDSWGFYEAMGYQKAGTLDRRGGEGLVFIKEL